MKACSVPRSQVTWVKPVWMQSSLVSVIWTRTVSVNRISLPDGFVTVEPVGLARHRVERDRVRGVDTSPADAAAGTARIPATAIAAPVAQRFKAPC